MKEFQLRGFFLVDVTYEPIDKGLSGKERKSAIMREISRLVADTQKLNPERIVIVKVSIFDPVKQAFEKAGFGEKILNKKPIRFPSDRSNSNPHKPPFHLNKRVKRIEIYF